MFDKYIEIDVEALIVIIGFVGCISLFASLIIR
jgi:hypothetical protein